MKTSCFEYLSDREFLLREYLRDMAYLAIAGKSYLIPMINAKGFYRNKR
jgi:hypothetical protein